jgi:6-pyruvoyltetrahydropterin/6-carboxytetrahydropterin synthase
MHKIKIVTHFSSAHFLPNYKGKCENLHGHNWKVEVTVSGKELDASGMVIDFNDLKRLTGEVLEELDHKNLNDLDYFKKYSPSSEEIAKYIFDKLSSKVSQSSCQIDEVRVWETENSCAIYQE